MDGNRKLTLEDIRRQSLEKWTEAQRRALNEATKNTPVNDRNAIGSGTGNIAGGSFASTGTEEQTFIQMYADANSNKWAYLTYSAASGEWSEIIQTDISTVEYDNIAIYPTNGYGWLINFSYPSATTYDRFVYINNKGEMTWDSDLIFTNDDWDIDTENAVGTASLFIDTGTEFKVITVYKDVVQTFTFDTYISGSSKNISDYEYDGNFRYSYGNTPDGYKIYLLNALTGGKTELFSVPPGYDYIVDSYSSSIGNAGSTIRTAPGVYFFMAYDVGTSLIGDTKFVDASGNVLVDIVAQCQDQGLPLNTQNWTNFWTYGSIYRTREITKANVAITTSANDLIVVNSGTGVFYIDSTPSGTTLFMPGETQYGDTFCVVTEPAGGYSSQGTILTPAVSGEQFKIDIISTEGSDNAFIGESISTNFITDSSNKIKTLALDLGVLGILEFNGNNPSATPVFTALSTSIYNSPSDTFNFNTGFTPSGLVEAIFDAYDSAAGDVNGYYLQDTYAPTLIHTGPGGGYSYYMNAFGERGPAAYGDSVTGELYVIDRTTRTSDEYVVPNTFGFNSDYSINYKTSRTSLVNSQTLDWQVVLQDSTFLQGSISSGFIINSVYTSTDYITTRQSPNSVSFFSPINGSLIEEWIVTATGTIIPCGNVIGYIDDQGSTRTITMYSGTHSAVSPSFDIGVAGNEYQWNDVYWWNW